jgi:hypothetical protein
VRENVNAKLKDEIITRGVSGGPLMIIYDRNEADVLRLIMELARKSRRKVKYLTREEAISYKGGGLHTLHHGIIFSYMRDLVGSRFAEALEEKLKLSGVDFISKELRNSQIITIGTVEDLYRLQLSNPSLVDLFLFGGSFYYPKLE